jgi:hypothetical protein
MGRNFHSFIHKAVRGRRNGPRSEESSLFLDKIMKVVRKNADHRHPVILSAQIGIDQKNIIFLLLARLVLFSHQVWSVWRLWIPWKLLSS